MGVSTDAILVWGFMIEEDSEEHEALELFMDEKYSELCAAQKKFPGCELVWHCSDDYTMYIVGLKETKAYRGEPKRIDSLDLPEDAQDTLNSFANLLGVEPQTGKWLLCSYWG